jgi:hypothetical protein
VLKYLSAIWQPGFVCRIARTRVGFKFKSLFIERTVVSPIGRMVRRFSRLALESGAHLPGGRDQVPQRGLGLDVAAGP